MLRRALRSPHLGPLAAEWSPLSRCRSMGSLMSRFEGIPKENADVVVIGAGVVGLAVARELALKGREVLVVEAAPTFGTGTSSRNSEVIHAGLYYPRDSLKATLCVRGRKLLYKYCMDRGIPHKQTGKFIVASELAQILKLEDLLRRGTENGVEGLRMMAGSEAMHVEPELYCARALMSPCSGIIDSHAFMLSMMAEAEDKNTIFSFNTTVLGGHKYENGMYLLISDSKELEKYQLKSSLEPQIMIMPRVVINSAGLSAIPLAKRFHGLSSKVIPSQYYARGCYFTLSNTRISPFHHLIYPIPEDGGLGVHVTLDLDGRVKFGPDVQWIEGVDDLSSFLNRYDYAVDSSCLDRFYSEIRKYFPNLMDGSLEPGYAGIRTKLSAPGEPSADFVIQGAEVHGILGLVNLFGIESPGLTCSLAIAEYIASQHLDR